MPRSTAEILRSHGLNATHVGELDMSTSTDDEIMAYARSRSLVVVTLDADFHALLALNGQNSPSVIRLRDQRLKGPAAAALIQSVDAKVENDLAAGALVSATKDFVRVKRLPIRLPRR